MSVPSITLANSKSIPQVGLGLWKVKDQDQFDNAFDSAIKAGYRLFDSAQHYGNEDLLGDCIKRSPLKREDLFITTKIAVQHFGYKKTHKTFKDSLIKLQSDYVDLILLHFPVSILRKKSWIALEEIYKSGQAKSIGVSNYTIRHLEEMKSYTKTMPLINQVEMHIFLQQPELREYCKKNNIALEAYSPLAHAELSNNEVVKSIADKHNKTYAQIMLRYLIELGLIVIPKSVHPERIKQNISIFDFKLDSSDMKKLQDLDEGRRTCWNPTHIP